MFEREILYWNPLWLPDGETFLFSVRQDREPERIVSQSLGSDEHSFLLSGTSPKFLSGEQLVFERNAEL